MMTPRTIRYLLIALMLVGLWQLAIVGKFYLKAWVADQLISQAWTKSLEEKDQIRPWSWADTWPVAELIVPRLNITEIVLMGDSGRILAFGPGLTERSAIPGDPGLSVISGHRDTHFNFLKDLREGDQLVLKTQAGTSTFILDELTVVDQNDFLIDQDYISKLQSPHILLVTCYPFDALIAGGDLRFIAIAKSQDSVI